MMECMLPPFVLMRVARWLEGGGEERLPCFAAVNRGIATALMRPLGGLLLPHHCFLLELADLRIGLQSWKSGKKWKVRFRDI